MGGNKYFQRQAMNVSPSELRKLADKLEKDYIKDLKELGVEIDEYDSKKKFCVNIINKTPCSDTWRFE